MRTVAPDANPYVALYALIKAGLAGMRANAEEMAKMDKKVYGGKVKKLPGNIYEALDYFGGSEFIKDIMGEDNQLKYAALKLMAAERSPRSLGNRIKGGEILYHHEVTNQLIWNQF